jgi:hypothetical protein
LEAESAKLENAWSRLKQLETEISQDEDEIFGRLANGAFLVKDNPC